MQLFHGIGHSLHLRADHNLDIPVVDDLHAGHQLADGVHIHLGGVLDTQTQTGHAVLDVDDIGLAAKQRVELRGQRGVLVAGDRGGRGGAGVENARHGGGAFSGKDSSKVDRSAAYAARYIAKNMVAAGIADEILVELSYAIGIAEPISVFVDTHGAVCSRNPKLADMTDGEIARRIAKLFDLRPAAIVKKFGLKNPIFEATASYGHFGNRPYTRKEKVWEDGREVEREIEFFGWEKLDAVDLIKQKFGL